MGLSSLSSSETSCGVSSSEDRLEPLSAKTSSKIVTFSSDMSESRTEEFVDGWVVGAKEGCGQVLMLPG